MQQHQIDSVLSFVDQVMHNSVREDSSRFDSIMVIAQAIHDIYEKYPKRQRTEEKKVELNLLNLLHEEENETAHSRIIQSLLSYNEDGNWTMLRSFLAMIESVFFDIDIKTPEILTEYTNPSTHCRIDILVREAGKYAIIIENKSNDAPYQKNQLANYIDMMLYEGFRLDQIYILLLADNHEASEEDRIWYSPARKADYEQEFSGNNRYSNVEFGTDILNWLKGTLERLFLANKILYALIIQYIDFLESKYIQSETDDNSNIRNMEIQDYITHALELTGTHASDASILSGKIQDITAVKKALDKMFKERVNSFMLELKGRLTELYPDNEVYDRDLETAYPTVGVKLHLADGQKELHVLFQVAMQTCTEWIGIEPFTKEERQEIIDTTAGVVKNLGGFRKGVNWSWLKSVDFTDVVTSMQELIAELEKIGWK